MCDPFTTQIIRNRQKKAQVLFSQASGLLKRLFPLPLPAPKRSKRACCRLGAVAPKRQHALYSSGVGGLLPIRATVEKSWLSSFGALRSSAAGSPAPCRDLP